MTKGYNQVFRTTTNWDKARYLERETYADIVQIPLEAQEKIYARKSMPVDGRPVREKTRAHSKLIIRMNRETGEVQTFVATFIPDKSYVNNPENKVSAVTYNPRRQNFSGIVLFSLLDGTFKYGNIYKDGEVVDRILGYHDAEAAGYDMTQVKNLSITLNGEIVTTRGWWCDEDGDDVMDIPCSSCGTNHGSVCIPPVTVPGDGGGGGGGGGIFIYEPGTGGGSGGGGGSGSDDLGGGLSSGGIVPPRPSPGITYRGIVVPGGEQGIENALREIDKDCLGNKIISSLSGEKVTVTIKYASGIDGWPANLGGHTNGKTFTDSGQIPNSSNTKFTFEVVLHREFEYYWLFEELFHACQEMEYFSKRGELNFETEAKVADYSYADRNNLLHTLRGKTAETWDHISNYIDDPNPETYTEAANATAKMGYRGTNSDGSPMYPDIEAHRNTPIFDKLSIDCK